MGGLWEGQTGDIWIMVQTLCIIWPESPGSSVWPAFQILGLLPGYCTLHNSRVLGYVFLWSTARGKRNGGGCSFYTTVLMRLWYSSHSLLLPWKFQPAPFKCTYNHQITPEVGMCCQAPVRPVRTGEGWAVLYTSHRRQLLCTWTGCCKCILFNGY